MILNAQAVLTWQSISQFDLRILLDKFCKFIFWRPPRVNTPKKFSMVIYDQRTAISVTRLSANAFLIFSLSLSSLSSCSCSLVFCKICIYIIYTHPLLPYEVFFPLAQTISKAHKAWENMHRYLLLWRGESFHPYFGVVFSSDTQKVLKTAHRYLLLCFSEDICCSAGERTVQSKAVKWALTTKCATPPPSALLWVEKCPMSVWPTIRKVSPVCTRTLITLWPMLCAATNRMHGKETFLITDINEAAAVVKLLGNHKVYFSSWMFRDSFNWVTR